MKRSRTTAKFDANLIISCVGKFKGGDLKPKYAFLKALFVLSCGNTACEFQ